VGTGLGVPLKATPKARQSLEPVFAFQPNLTHMQSLPQEQHACTLVGMEKGPGR